jgi:hypothetical protein
MRIEKHQLIAGLPAKDVRRFMREAAGFIIRPRTVVEVLGFSQSDARQLLQKMQNEGLLAVKEDYWLATSRGHALAMATAARPLRRATAQRLIEEVVERARVINGDNEFAYRVHGSLCSEAFWLARNGPNDVDIGCCLVARFDGEKQRVLEDERRKKKGWFTNTSECAVWPKMEVLKKLKSRSRGLSVQEIASRGMENIDHKVVFSDDTRTDAPEWG